jgi:hypothetical protein
MLRGREDALLGLQRAGCQTDIFCYWVSSGQGGPSLDVPTLSALSGLGLEIWWDVSFGEPKDYEGSAPVDKGGT